MTLSEIINLVPVGVLDHVRVYLKDVRILNIKDQKLSCYNVDAIAPSLHCESSKCKCVYDAHIDVYISEGEELPFE